MIRQVAVNSRPSEPPSKLLHVARIRPNPESGQDGACLHGSGLRAGKAIRQEVVNLGEQI